MASIKKIVFFIFFCLVGQSYGQVNIVGKSGAIFTPSAEWSEHNSLIFSTSYVPSAYSINKFVGGVRRTENIYSISVPVTGFMKIHANLTRLPEIPDSIGIGDRHFDFSFLLLKELERRPAILLVLSPNFGWANFMSQDLIVATKSFSSNRLGLIVASMGYASPFYLGRPPHPDVFGLPNTFKFHRKKDMDRHYLVGFFGSVKWQPRDFVALLLEHDSQKWNMGLMLRWKEYLSVQGHLLNGKDPAFTLATRIPLNSEPFEMRNARKK
ncbi:YjbH domain-containing protein [Lunatimonas salinarum]|uniref:YjbH domain-containing protein n=1 Tax=Lunatimonas salinarum TaxID=1774590 RepID=UPI001AE0BB85|nr:YjbH domain-containing protein [Lunatimonas salinarum]